MRCRRETFGCRAEEVFPSSTGIIGVPLPAEKLIAVLPDLAASLGADASHFHEAARAILTTDTVEKVAFARLASGGSDGAVREVRIAAFGKGSGMIHPQLVPHATMLVYILTDADIAPADLNGYLRPAVEVSFNRISVDGDTSTNDTVLLLASGASGVRIGAGRCGLRLRAHRGLHVAGAAGGCRRRGQFRTWWSCASTARPATPMRCAWPRPSPTRRW